MRRFEDVWVEQCAASREVRERHGVVAALDYLVGEKLLQFAETAIGRPEFRRQLPNFVAGIRRIFSAEELRAYCEHLERMEDIAGAPAEAEESDEFAETEEERRRRLERRAWLKELLTVGELGTG